MFIEKLEEQVLATACIPIHNKIVKIQKADVPALHLDPYFLPCPHTTPRKI